ncbi:MAG: glycosyltransferase [Microbacteriaceae bacterium]
MSGLRDAAPRALVASDSPIARDPRVLRQVRWLTDLGYTVDTLGRGPKAPEVSGTHYAMPRRAVAVRTLSYLLLPNPVKYRTLITSTIPTPLREGAAGGIYDLVVLNEIELLPWFVAVKARLVRAGGRTHLDLHEFAPSQRSGLAYRLVFKRFRDWLVSFIPLPEIDTRSTVAGGIARLYTELFAIDALSIIRSTPDYVDQQPSPVDPQRIRLVHHGVASATRGLDLLITALSLADKRFTLDLMLVGSDDALAPLKRLAEPLGERVTFRPPVDVRDIATAINQYDAELIFFPPVTQNLRFALPNKFFESVQGRLAIITGESSEMVEIVEQYGNGLVVHGWTAADLAAALNSLDAASVTAMKRASDAAAHDLSSQSERARFVAALGLELGLGFGFGEGN